MQSKRPDRAPGFDAGTGITIPFTTETLRSSATHPSTKTDDERVSLFWRVFGGTILSICALVVLTLFNHLNGSLSELRAEIARLNEARADGVKKDEFNTRTTSMWDRVQGMQSQQATLASSTTAVQAEMSGLKERASKQAADLDVFRKELAAVEVLKERVIALEGLKKDLAVLEAVREKMAAMVAENKLHHEELMKVRTEVDRNVAADQERKTRRDVLQNQTEEAIKELTKGLQDCREKLARLEGPAKPAPEKKPGG